MPDAAKAGAEGDPATHAPVRDQMINDSPVVIRHTHRASTDDFSFSTRPPTRFRRLERRKHTDEKGIL